MNNDLINVIRNKSDIVEIIGERVPLVLRGKNYFGVCPFHDDSNPSMSVSRDKQIYKCFSCGATGNVFTFLMNYDHMSFPDALKYLGERAGVSVKGIHTPVINNRYDNLYEAYKLSVKYYQNNLNSVKGREAKKYLFDRGLDESVIKEFNIGYSLDTYDDLTKLLINKKYELGVLNNIGLSVDNHDMYNDRIMFPLDDVSGRIVGFSGRIYKDIDTNKYLNTKETPIFKKGEMLYHYYAAREEVRKEKFVIVMEGFMDVIRAFSIGVKNTIALMGTAMTKEHVELIKRLSNNVVLCLDGDEAGIHANLVNGEELVKAGCSVFVLPLSGGDDPDTYILKNGKERFLDLIKNKVNFSDYKINKMRDGINFNSDVDKSRYINSVIVEIAKVKDIIHREIMLKDLAKEFDLGYNTLEIKLRELLLKEEKKEPVISVSFKPKEKARGNMYTKAVDRVLYGMMNNDYVINEVNLRHVVFPTIEDRMLASEASYYYEKYGSINMADFITYLSDKPEILSRCMEVIKLDINSEMGKEELEDCLNRIDEFSAQKEIERLTKEMKKELDSLKKAKISDQIRKIRIGEK